MTPHVSIIGQNIDPFDITAHVRKIKQDVTEQGLTSEQPFPDGIC